MYIGGVEEAANSRCVFSGSCCGFLDSACYLCFLYWLATFGYTIAKYLEGGEEKVVAYYGHLLCENRFDPCQFSWSVFFIAQSIYLSITLLLCFWEWRFL